jgi:cytochrome c-type biogenesis protein CcmE
MSDLDLTPRVSRGRRRSKWVPLSILLLVGVAVAAMVWFLVTNTQNFLEADIAVAEREDTGDRRLQLLGSPTRTSEEIVAATTVVGGNEYTPFTVTFDGTLVDVVSQGTPPDLFDKAIPVVLEGHWVNGPVPIEGYTFPGGANDGWWFSTDRILVKHDNDYREDRLDDADERGRLSDEPGGDTAPTDE